MKHIVQNHYEMQLDLIANPFSLQIEDLFALATRNNPLRRFLFVSKVLGKHLPVKPATALLYGRLLAMHYFEKSYEKEVADHHQVLSTLGDIENNAQYDFEHHYPLEEGTLVIGFAETATGLGHIVFDAFESPVGYYHTTREQVKHAGSVICFEEEHSHATSHLIYEHKELQFKEAKNILLVDDEISTGKSMLNIIDSIYQQFGITKFSVLTFLDWRSEENRLAFDAYARIHGIQINVVSLLTGHYSNVKEGELALSEIATDPLFQKKMADADQNSCQKSLEKKVWFDELRGPSDSDGLFINYHGYTGRFGLSFAVHQQMLSQMQDVIKKVQGYVKDKTLVLGTEEFNFIPMKIAAGLKGDVYFKSTTRSPIYPFDHPDYPIKSGIAFKSLGRHEVDNYVYNLAEENYDTILLMVEYCHGDVSARALYQKLSDLCPNVRVMYFLNQASDEPNYPPIIGSYTERDVVFLLKEITDEVAEQDNESRERAIQSGVHYSEMLPVEYKPSDIYLQLFYDSLNQFSDKLAVAVGIVSERILAARGKNLVLVSLARAGSPAGVLIKKYMEKYHPICVEHYSISIIRGKGIDQNALRFICNRHPHSEIQFIDGWTGKGAITTELNQAVEAFQDEYGPIDGLKSTLAVIADPAHCVPLYGTREDFLIPNACLNSTVSGLLSRTVYRMELLNKSDYHAVKFYKGLTPDDLSQFYIDQIEKKYEGSRSSVERALRSHDQIEETESWLGLKDVESIQRDFLIENIHFIKPGIGETTRVLLRRIPWKILVKEGAENLEHIYQLAQEKNIPIEYYPLTAYHCCGLVKSLQGE